MTDHRKIKKFLENRAQTRDETGKFGSKRVERPEELSEEERFLVVEASKDPALFSAVFLKHHITRPFASFHAEIFELLKRLVKKKGPID